MNRIYLLLSACLLALQAEATDKTLHSPDGKLSVTVSDRNGKPSYSVAYDGTTFLLDSPLGMQTSLGDFSQGMTMTEATGVASLDKRYELPTIKQRWTAYKANRQSFTFSQDGKRRFDIVFQVSDRDVAFRYRLYPQGDSHSCVMLKEATGFVLPQGTTTFLCPQSKAMGGFARTWPSYETNYVPDDIMGKNGEGEGYSFPCLFRCGDEGWVLISETGTDSGYCACRLIGQEGGLYTIGFPQAAEMNGLGSANPGLSLPAETPWRTITVGRDLAPIVETTVAWDVVSPKYKASQTYQYGKGSWSWIIGMDASTNFEEQMRYIDFSAAMGYQSVLIDAWWDKQIGYDRIEQLAMYGKQKGVALYLWYNSNGYWNDAPQTPKGIMDNTISRRKEMAWMKRIGIRGIKVDFFGSDKQEMMKLYEDILTDANDFGLLVIFHGCTLPRGWERMYPNYAASEAVLASENLNFNQSSCDNEARNACLHPFIRNTVGSMDFGGSALNRYYNAQNQPGGSRRVTSDVFALATAVLFQSPVQHFALAPNNLQDAPAWAMDFMKEVPSTWDEVKFIDGYPGQYVILARRKADTWYIAGINARKEPLKTTLYLPMFSSVDNLRCYSDDKNLNGSLKTLKLNRKLEVKIEIPQNGAIVIANEKENIQARKL